MLQYPRRATRQDNSPSITKVSNMFRVAVMFPINSSVSGLELAKLSDYNFKVVTSELHFSKNNVAIGDIPIVPTGCIVITDSLGVVMINSNNEGWKPLESNRVIPELFADQVW